MIGTYDFCGHYEWTFAWLEAQGGHALVRAYWDEAINHDSQKHARELILSGGVEGMKKYWGHALEQEEAGYHVTATGGVLRIDMHDCPSKGFLIRNGLVQYRDYCDHCMGWIGPLMMEAGFVIDHEHNHRGQCWWEMRTRGAAAAVDAGRHDVRLRPDWNDGVTPMDRYEQANDCDQKRAGGS
jgi:hypothetical protein